LIAGLLIAWAVGSILGPVIAGAFMEAGLGPSGLFVYAAVALALLVVVMMLRRGARPPVEAEEAEKEAFVPGLATSTYAADLDARVAEESAEPQLPFDQKPHDPPAADASEADRG
jgi:MFS family permease